MNLEGHVAVVTGASRGVGRAIADALEARGLAVATVARRSAQFTADVSNPADVDRLKTAVEAELGRPTILVNAAGVFGPIALVQDSDPGEWVETLMINAVGPYLVSRAFLDGMLERRLGPDREPFIGGGAAHARAAEQRLRHGQGRSQPVHPATLPPR